MKAKRNDVLKAVRRVEERFSHWRAARKDGRERIPAGLWQAAAKLCDRYSVHRVSRWLGLNHTALQRASRRLRRERPRAPSFVECRLPAQLAPAVSTAEYVVEVGGKAARIHARGVGGADVAALVNALTASGPAGSSSRCSS